MGGSSSASQIAYSPFGPVRTWASEEAEQPEAPVMEPLVTCGVILVRSAW